MHPVIAVVGPTAIGKSELALKLCQTLGGEIIGADSRQIYRYMDIGTAKPTPEERKQVPHYLIDEVDPDEEFGLALYQKRAKGAVEDIQERKKTALLVGGSGLYVWSLLEGWRIPEIPPDLGLRRNLEQRACIEGGESLYQELSERDPAAAQRIDSRNVRRVIRALEVCRQGGTFSQLQVKQPFFNWMTIGLTADRDRLYRRIDSRVDTMIQAGLVDEVEGLVKNGYGYDLTAMSGIGYKQIGMYLRGEMDLSAAIERMKFATHRYVRQQYNWFSLQDKRINWLTLEEAQGGSLMELVRRFLENQVGGGLEYG